MNTETTPIIPIVHTLDRDAKRTLLAGLAMQSFIGTILRKDVHNGDVARERVALAAVMQADALLKELERNL